MTRRQVTAITLSFVMLVAVLYVSGSLDIWVSAR
jgi:hypothetical protein